MTGHFDDEGVAAAFRAMFTERSGDVPMSPAPYTRLRRRIVHARRQRRLRAGGAAVALVVAAAGAGAWAAAGRSGGAATVPATPSSKGTKYTYDDGVTAFADGHGLLTNSAGYLKDAADQYLRRQGFQYPPDAGYTVVTTFDQQMTADAATVADQQLWKAKPKGGSLGPGTHLSFTVVDPANGRLLALYNEVDGVADYAADQRNRAVAGQLALGPLMYPVTVAAALGRGYTLNSKEPAQNTRQNHWPIGAVGPDNVLYFGSGGNLWPPPGPDQLPVANGLIDLHDALVNAVQPAIADLGLEPDVTPQEVYDTATALGIRGGETGNTHDFNPNPSVTLGVSTASPLSVAEMYAAFADGGRHRTTIVVGEVRNAAGQVVWRPKDDTTQVLAPQTAAAVQGALHDEVTRRLGQAKPSDLSGQVAGNDYPVVWMAGSGGGLTMAVAMFRDYDSGADPVRWQTSTGGRVTPEQYPAAVWAGYLALEAGRKQK